MKFSAWTLFVALVVGLVGGAILGRELHWGSPKSGPSVSDVVVSKPDAGPVPIATSDATTQPVSCDAGVVVVVKPGKPYVVYLPADAGSVTCPACQEVTVEAHSGSVSGGSVAHSDAPVVPPVIITQTEYKEVFHTFGIGGGGGYTWNQSRATGNLTVALQPFEHWEVIVQATTQPAINGSILYRFGGN